jgi:putative Mg2+ transporter-C (MgtC) family protein
MEEFFLKLLLASFFGAAIGFQREVKDRPAGLRTHTLVALASCVFTVASLEAFQGGDPSRIASNVAVGIGFIGAGTIIKQGNLIIGLTTAASLWTVAAIGVLTGAGKYLMAAITAFMALMVLIVLKEVEERVGRKKLLEFEVRVSESDLEKLMSAFEKTGFVLDLLEVKKENDYLLLSGSYRLKTEKEREKCTNILKNFGEITFLRWQ